MTWLRLYTSILNDLKVQRLPEKAFKGWINLLCLAKENDGVLPDAESIEFALRMQPDEVSELIAILTENGLLDKTKQGICPHNWNGRQYVSDVSTERVKRHRKRKRNVSVTPPDRTETETEKTETHVGVRDVRKAFENYNIAAEQLSLPKAENLTPDRVRKLRARLTEHGISGWNDALRALTEQPFCLGEGGRGWKANLDFLLQPESLNKVRERAYAKGEENGI